jgi:Predicted Fe-S oxidoreductases
MEHDLLVGNPNSIIVDTTIVCHSGCFFCWRANKKEHLRNILTRHGDQNVIDFNLFKKIIDNAVCYDNIRWISLCGPMGEPLTNKDFTVLTRYVHDCNHFTTFKINTNGMHLDIHDPELLLNTVTYFSISVDSIRPETYKKIHGVSCLNKIITHVRNLVEYKRKNGSTAAIFVRFTENQHNRGEFKEFEQFFSDLGVDGINYTKVHNFIGVIPELSDQKAIRQCNQGKTINFNFLGEMTTCCINWRLNPVFGSIAGNTIEEMWNGPRKKWWDERTHSEPCTSCSGVGPHVQKKGLADA